MEADVYKVSVLQSSGLEDGGEVAAEVVPSYDVVLRGAGSAAAACRRTLEFESD